MPSDFAKQEQAQPENGFARFPEGDRVFESPEELPGDVSLFGPQLRNPWCQFHDVRRQIECPIGKSDSPLHTSLESKRCAKPRRSKRAMEPADFAISSGRGDCSFFQVHEGLRKEKKDGKR